MMNLKNFTLLAACFSIVLLFNCCRPQFCLAPPPSLSFVLLDKNNKDSLKVTYLNASNAKEYINPLINFVDSLNTSASFNTFIDAYAIIPKSFILKDPVFNLEFAGNVIGKINLKTFKHNEKCNNWENFSEVRFNEKVVTHDNTTDVFVFKTN
jgi:hypothetical protein